MTDRERVSVLMTVYNAAPWLREAVESVLAQTFADLSLIAVDDGSTDGSADILRSYADPRVRVVALSRNVGRIQALRHAFDLAHGEYLAVLDADDVWEPEMLATTVAYLDARPEVVLVGTWATQIDGAGNRIGAFEPPTDERELLDSFAWQNPFVHSAALYRSEAARAVGGYPADVPYAQDFALWLRLALHGKVRMIGTFLARHRTVSTSMTMLPRTKPIVTKDTLDLLRVANRQLPLSAAARRRGREEIAIAGFRHAVALASARRWREAAAAGLRSIATHPRALLWNRVYRAALFG